MHSWSNISSSREKSVDNVVGKSPVNISSKNVSQGAGKANSSQLTCERNSSPHLTARSPMGGNTSLLRPLVTIQDPFSSQSFSGINSASSHGSLTSSFVGNRQRKQSYGRAAVKKIWHTYSGGGGSTSSTTGNSISSSSSNSSAASTRKGKT